MTEKMYEKLKRNIIEAGPDAVEDLLGQELTFYNDEEMLEAMDDVLDQMPEDIAMEFYNKYCKDESLLAKILRPKDTVRLHIGMNYIFVGDTGIDIPIKLLEGKSKEEQLQIAHDYAQEHIDEIPVASNAEYICDSDSFELDDICFESDLEELIENEEIDME